MNTKPEMIGANRRNNPPGGFTDAKCKKLTRRGSLDIRNAAKKWLDARGLTRGPDSFSGRQAKML